jgi:hypothetical protein
MLLVRTKLAGACPFGPCHRALATYFYIIPCQIFVERCRNAIPSINYDDYSTLSTLSTHKLQDGDILKNRECRKSVDKSSTPSKSVDNVENVENVDNIEVKPSTQHNLDLKEKLKQIRKNFANKPI